MKDLKEIVKSDKDSYYYAKSLKFKNVPYIILKSIAKNTNMSYCYAFYLNFKNVPLIILKSATKYCNFINGFPENKHLLIYMLQCDKRMNILI